jgi:hypothetical protein
MEFAHHVVPNQCGNPADPTHQWLRTLVNCVLVCHQCHQRVHEDGDTKLGAVAPPKYFPYSHKDPAAHRKWARQLRQLSSAIWLYRREVTRRNAAKG